MGFSGSGSVWGETIWGWRCPAQLGLALGKVSPSFIGFHAPHPPTDLPLLAVQRHTFSESTPGVCGSGAPSHGQPSFGPV